MCDAPSFVQTITNYSTAILCCITIVLAILTFFYLRETKKMRQLTQVDKDMALTVNQYEFCDICPKVTAKENINPARRE